MAPRAPVLPLALPRAQCGYTVNERLSESGSIAPPYVCPPLHPELTVEGTSMAVPTKELILKVLEANQRRAEMEPAGAGSPPGTKPKGPGDNVQAILMRAACHAVHP